MNPLETKIVILAASVYFMRTLVFMLGAWLERRRHAHDSEQRDFTPFVSVVVPARNEEINIERCIRSLMASQYPYEKLEVIAVNDRSSDRTSEILSALQVEFPNLIIHNTLDDRSNSNLQGKPRAVHQGITRSQGEVILMTDADCTVAPTWIRTMAQVYATPHIGLVASFTVVSGNRFFDRLQMLEWTINSTMASAGVGLKQPLGCFGNNLSVRRSVYEELGGYEHIVFSVTEDLALLQAVHNAGYEVRYLCDAAAKVETMPCPNLAAFAKQHHRWVNGGKALGWRGHIFVASSAVMWIGIGAALLEGSWILALGLIVARIIANMLLTAPSFAALRMKSALWQMPLAEPFFIAIELIMPFWAMQSKVEWKGQVLRSH
jgi:1,2-diacylglycerol 3-beta-glucosyltransferase